MTFKPGDKIFSHKTVSDDEWVIKAGSKYRGQVFYIERAGLTERFFETIKGIWLMVLRGRSGTHYLNFINLGEGEVRTKTGPFFHNELGYVSLNEEYGVKLLVIGEAKISEAKQKELIKYLFEDFKE